MTISRLPLTWRFVLLSGVGLLIVTIISTLIARELMRKQFDEVRDRELRLLADHVAADLAEDAGDDRESAPSFGPSRFNEIFSGAYWEVEFDGEEDRPLRSRSLWDDRITGLPDKRAKDALGFATGPVGQQVRFLDREVETGGRKARLLVAIDTAEYTQMQDGIGQLFTIALVVEGLLALMTAGAIAIVSLRSIRRFTADLQALRAGETDQLDENISSDIVIAAQEVNALKAAQTRLVTRAREQAAALAHSLKTPLSVIIQAAEKSETESARDIRQQAEAALSHVHHHLAMARSAGPMAGHRATRLKPVIEGICRVLGSRAAESGINIAVDVPDDLNVRIEEADLHDIMGNLMENAIRHAGNIVRVSAAIGKGATTIQVEDDGPGLHEAERSAVLQRGFSASGEAGATGLGLTITRDLVESYDGEFRLTTASIGGLGVTIRLTA